MTHRDVPHIRLGDNLHKAHSSSIQVDMSTSITELCRLGRVLLDLNLLYPYRYIPVDRGVQVGSEIDLAVGSNGVCRTRSASTLGASELVY